VVIYGALGMVLLGNSAQVARLSFCAAQVRKDSAFAWILGEGAKNFWPRLRLTAGDSQFSIPEIRCNHLPFIITAAFLFLEEKAKNV
jgi:predicted mannosyl-3-phosphoglycerate phosphatase (HAD superfamily)